MLDKMAWRMSFVPASVKACINGVPKIKIGISKIINQSLMKKKTLRAILTEITRTGL